ncbi:MAG: MBL fold metallo-hydrolase [Elusimicrobia bacterium]|nr:MBL fold metallo-hydrolase [Elusimicrobiota bacterium]
MANIKKVISGQLEVNCYIIYDETSKAAVIIDPGADFDCVCAEIEKLKLKPELLINTHGHYDHILSDDLLRSKYNIPLAIGIFDAPMLTDSKKNASFFMGCDTALKPAEILLEDNQKLKTSFCEFLVITTPGHTRGSVCLKTEGALFSGDTLFAGSIGRTDFPGGDLAEMKKSLQRLMALPKTLKVYPGHGPATTIDNEMRHNPYVNGDYL